MRCNRCQNFQYKLVEYGSSTTFETVLRDSDFGPHKPKFSIFPSSVPFQTSFWSFFFVCLSRKFLCCKIEPMESERCTFCSVKQYHFHPSPHLEPFPLYIQGGSSRSQDSTVFGVLPAVQCFNSAEME